MMMKVYPLIFFKVLGRKSGDTLSSSPSSTLDSLPWSGTDTIINAHDSMQNPGQTQIFYKPGHTRLTWTKHESVEPKNPGDPTQFQPWYVCHIVIIYCAHCSITLMDCVMLLVMVDWRIPRNMSRMEWILMGVIG